MTQTGTSANAARVVGLFDAAAMKHAQLHGSETTSLQDGHARTLKHDDVFAVFNHAGDALAGVGSQDGVYFCDTRYLSHFQLTMMGASPKVLSSNLSDDNTTLTCDLTNPDLFDRQGRVALAQGSIHLRRTRLLWRDSVFERLAVTNFSDRPQTIQLRIDFAADFADLFEVRGAKRERHGRALAPEERADRVRLSYTGLDHETRETTVRFWPAPARLTGGVAAFEITSEPHQTSPVFIEVGCGPELANRTLPDGFFVALRDSRRALLTVAKATASVTTSNEVFNEAVTRSVADLNMLTTRLSTGRYPYAGIPWFSTVFGRDALITAWQTLWFDPSLARGVLAHLAANQATEEIAAADAEPGKILHEARGGEMANLGEVPFRRYYGSVDSTPLFVLLAGAYLERTGDLAFIRRLMPHLEAALGWIDRYGDRDGDGFVEYGRRSADGLANQGWKDSHDSIFHADGAYARGAIALVEVQAYVYAARQAMAGVYGRIGDGDRAIDQTAKADALRTAFDRAFFDEDLATYVIALDGDKKPCRVRSSNAGHALFGGIALPERAATVVKTLMSGSSFSGWGVRTLASTEARYNPMSYHNGSVWPHDNAIIAAGFARYNFRPEASRIFEGLFSASTYIDMQRLPELFCGFARQRGRGPTFYPVACAPQAWAAAAFLSLLQSSLGLAFDEAEDQIVLQRPVLPAFLERVTLRRLSYADRTIDVAIHRDGAQVLVEALADSDAPAMPSALASTV